MIRLQALPGGRCPSTGAEFHRLVVGGRESGHAAPLLASGAHWVLGGLRRDGALTGYEVAEAEEAYAWLAANGPLASACAWRAGSAREAARIRDILTERS